MAPSPTIKKSNTLRLLKKKDKAVENDNLSNKSQLSEDFELDFNYYEKSKYEKINEEYMNG